MDVTEVRSRLAAAGIRPSKGLGQHFLLDERVAARQVGHGGVRSGDTVLEIGPGLGILTGHLAAAARRVVAVEADRRLAKGLTGTWPNVEVIRGDALTVDLPRFDVAVANLPFQISSPITFRILDLPFRRASLMYQEEFARRLVATAGTEDYSRLSVKAYCRSRAAVVERVPPSAFWPPPKVHSAVAVLEPRAWPFPVRDPRLFDGMVDVLFQHRRKKIGTTMEAAWRELGLPRAPGRDLPERDRRVEELSPEALGRLADSLDAS